MTMTDDQLVFERFCNGAGDTLLHKQTAEDGTRVAVIKLMFHVALYVNPESVGLGMNYDHRYCYANLEAALAGVELFNATGEWMLWQKDHCNQVSVVNGYLYQNGAYHSPECASGMAGWNEKDVAAGRYLYYFAQWSQANDKVWVHCSDGSTVGRFGRNGIDMHTTVTEQLAGAGECRLCTHDAVTAEDWSLFREKARMWWCVDIPADAFTTKLLAKAYQPPGQAEELALPS